MRGVEVADGLLVAGFVACLAEEAEELGEGTRVVAGGGGELEAAGVGFVFFVAAQLAGQQLVGDAVGETGELPEGNLLRARLDADGGHLAAAQLLFDVALAGVDDFVAEHPGELRLVLEVRQQPPGDEDVPAGGGEGVDHLGVEDAEVILHILPRRVLRHRGSDQVHVLHRPRLFVQPEDGHELRARGLADGLFFFG